jgi:hypothetical protein
MLPGTDQILAGLIQAGGKTLFSKIHSFLNYILSKCVPGSVHVGFCGEQSGPGTSFLDFFGFPVNIIPLWFSMLIYHLGDEQ